MEFQTFWLEHLRKYATLDELKRSVFFADHGAQIESYLRTPQVVRIGEIRPCLHSFLRIVQWNIEKGKRFLPILQWLQTDEILKWADVIILNEADLGMIRSENRKVARELAEALKMHSVFGPAHFELTKGVDEELLLKGENCESLQGNAILSRYPVVETRILPLPASFEPYESHEKRFGSRSCLWARIQIGDSFLWIGAMHLELRNTPRCRAKQMRHILQHLPCARNEAVVLGGDFNTNSFRRGTSWRTLRSMLQLLFSSPAQLKQKLLYAGCAREPLFRILESSGFERDQMNSKEETARTCIDSLEEVGSLPVYVLKIFNKRLEPYEGYLRFKLDWLIGRNIQSLREGQKRDSQTGILSLNPGTVKMDNFGPGRLSDHLPIYADVDLA